MRAFIDIIESVIQADTNAGAVRVLRNPSPEQVWAMLVKSNNQMLRGYADATGAYFWDAFYGTHHDIAKSLGLDYDYLNRLTVRDKYGFAYVDWDENASPDRNRYVARVVNSDRFTLPGEIVGSDYVRDLMGTSNSVSRPPA